MSESLSVSDRTHKRRWIILILINIVIFMSTLDSSIVNVALPTMADQLGVGSGIIAWVITIYLIAIAAVILVFGRLGDIFGQTKIFNIGILVFTIGSALCGLSHTLPMLLLARVIQAIGAGATMGNNQGIITRVFPPSERGRALGFAGTSVALGTLAGPALGGLIVSVTSWEYIFWINIPIGIVAFILCLRELPKRAVRKQESLDIKGSLLFFLTVVPLFFAMNQIQIWGVSDFRVRLCLALSIISFLMFLSVEKKSSTPLLDLTIFKNKWFTVSIICAFLSYIVLFSSAILQPFYLQNVRGLSPGTAGLLMCVMPLVMAIAAPLSGHLSDKVGSEILTLTGLIVTLGGVLLMATLTQNTSLIIMSIFVAILSLGNANFQSPNTSLTMSSVTRDKLGIGGSVNALARNFGMVCGITLSTSLLYGGMSQKLGTHVTAYSAGQENAFIYGMRLAYLAAAVICAIAIIITAVRLHGRKIKAAPAKVQ